MAGLAQAVLEFHIQAQVVLVLLHMANTRLALVATLWEAHREVQVAQADPVVCSTLCKDIQEAQDRSMVLRVVPVVSQQRLQVLDDRLPN